VAAERLTPRPADGDPGFGAVLSGVKEAIEGDLAPNVRAVDADGVYPEAFMRKVGGAGGYRQATPVYLGGAGRGVRGTIRVMEEVSGTCLSTGFCVWCQTVCAWYIQNGESDYLKERVLPGVISGEVLAGTGLSNPMKHFAGIERIKISARRCTGGYVLNGTVPWVSNVDLGHVFAVAAAREGEGGYVMALVPAGAPGVRLGEGGRFIALEGSSTRSAILKDAFLPEEFVLASPAQGYVGRIRSGFVLTQTGFGLGLVEGCVGLMKRANASSRGWVNGFLDDRVEAIEADLQAVRGEIYSLADEVGCGEEPEGGEPRRPGLFGDVVRARARVSELSLRASQAAMLHAGASGYRQHSEAERRLRESYFVAVVTPALKHLKKVLHDIEGEEVATGSRQAS